MLKIQWLWVLSLLPLPMLYRLLLPPATSNDEAALRVPFLQDFKSVRSTGLIIKRNKLHFWLAALAWVCLVVAASRPQWLGEPIELPVTGRDILMAVDLSGSMDTKDFYVNKYAIDRLTAAKVVAGEFIKRRAGDRIGLILFGHHAYVQTPLTFDRETVKTLLDEAVIGMAGKKTAIGDAIGLAVKRMNDTRHYNEDQAAKNESPVLKTADGGADKRAAKEGTGNESAVNAARQAESNKKSQKPILILLTDGANTAGEVEPVKAAELAANLGLRIYTIGVGADEMYVQSFFGARKINPSADLDEHTLREIARNTGGRYFRARDTEELKEIYGIIDSIEPIASENKSYRPQKALYPWPLSAALVLGASVLLLQVFRK